jgi:molecular chaperone HscB
MNYFEFYDLPESFALDAALIKKKFYELSKRYHPDFYANEDDAKQQEILELSTLNNKVYQVLTDPGKRMEYILKQHGLLTDGEKYELAPEFLMDMMDINEALMEVDDAAALNTIKAQISDTEERLNNQLTTHITNYQAEDEVAKQLELKAIKDIYFKQKYLLRIKDTLDTFAARL